MAEQQSKIKKEIYANLGGINTKISQYEQGENEFLALENFDFSVPGALSQRPGSTLIVQPPSLLIELPVSGLYDFQDLAGFSAIVTVIGLTCSIVKFQAGGATLSAIENVHPYTLSPPPLFDFVTFVDRLFACGGNDFFKFGGGSQGYSAYPVGLPSFNTSSFTGSVFPFFNVDANTVINGNTGSAFTPGFYVYSLGYLNDRGYFGTAIMSGDNATPGMTGILYSVGVTITGTSTFAVDLYLSDPPINIPPSGYGITALVIYRSGPGSLDLFEIGYSNSALINSTFGSSNPFFIDLNFPLTSVPAPLIFQMTLMPKYLEIYNNSLCAAGYSGFPSTLFPSQLGEPESLDFTISNEIRTNDGDVISGLKSFQNFLVVTKERSFHAVSGFDPNNFSVQQISDQYGCISNQAMVIYNQMMMFLDVKGVVMFDGANVSIVSNKVEPIFLRMNIQAARQHALAVHVRLRNEVWFVIPVDGSEVNNMIVVYDYIVNAWTTYTQLDLTYICVVNSQFPAPTISAGDPVGNIITFGASFLSDYNDDPIIPYYQTHFLRDLGESIEKQWRRLFLNIDPTLDPTNFVQINLYKDYNSQSVIIGTTMPLAPFQNRIDFGIPAKSLSYDLTYIPIGTTGFIRVFGFTIESRYQRAV